MGAERGVVMRLIDADVLKEYSYGREDTYGDIKQVVDVEDIDNAPTIKPKVVIIEHDIIEKLADSVVDVISKIDWDKAIEAYKERPQGEWIRHIRSIECSVCKDKFFADDENENCQDYEPCTDFNFNFCPNCGADMRKEAEND